MSNNDSSNGVVFVPSYSFKQISESALLGVACLLILVTLFTTARRVRRRWLIMHGFLEPGSNLSLGAVLAGAPGRTGPVCPVLDQAAIDALGPVSEFTPTEEGEKSKRLESVGGDVEKGTDENRECSVCLLEYKAKEMLRTLDKCGHKFHQNCIDPWLKDHGSCPLCRTSFIPQQADQQQLQPQQQQVGSQAAMDSSAAHTASAVQESFASIPLGSVALNIPPGGLSQGLPQPAEAVRAMPLA